MEKEYEKKVYVKAFQFNGNAIEFAFNPDTPKWAVEAYKNSTIKRRDSETLYIDHREHTDFAKNGDYIIRSEFGNIFSLSKEDFEKMYVRKNGWIPCSERLPECGAGMFLACAENGYIFMAVRSHDGDFREMYTIGLEGFSEDNPIVAWQPLPAPYEVESDE